MQRNCCSTLCHLLLLELSHPWNGSLWCLGLEQLAQIIPEISQGWWIHPGVGTAEEWMGALLCLRAAGSGMSWPEDLFICSLSGSLFFSLVCTDDSGRCPCKAQFCTSRRAVIPAEQGRTAHTGAGGGSRCLGREESSLRSFPLNKLSWDWGVAHPCVCLGKILEYSSLSITGLFSYTVNCAHVREQLNRIF